MIIKIKIQTIMIIILKIGSCKNHAKKIFHNSKEPLCKKCAKKTFHNSCTSGASSYGAPDKNCPRNLTNYTNGLHYRYESNFVFNFQRCPYDQQNSSYPYRSLFHRNYHGLPSYSSHLGRSRSSRDTNL